jgi:hypothetical protein
MSKEKMLKKEKFYFRICLPQLAHEGDKEDIVRLNLTIVGEVTSS